MSFYSLYRVSIRKQFLRKRNALPECRRPCTMGKTKAYTLHCWPQVHRPKKQAPTRHTPTQSLTPGQRFIVYVHVQGHACVTRSLHPGPGESVCLSLPLTSSSGSVCPFVAPPNLDISLSLSCTHPTHFSPSLLPARFHLASSVSQI